MTAKQGSIKYSEVDWLLGHFCWTYIKSVKRCLHRALIYMSKKCVLQVIQHNFDKFSVLSFKCLLSVFSVLSFKCIFLSFSFAPSPLLDGTLPCWESFLPVLQPAPSQVHQLVGKRKTWQIVLEMYIYIYHKRQHPVLPSSGLFQIQLRIWRWGTPIVLTCVGRTNNLRRMFDAKKLNKRFKEKNKICVFFSNSPHTRWPRRCTVEEVLRNQLDDYDY